MIHKKLDNRGFSLVELLVAVAVLAIVVTPLLHSFITSAHLSKRSRELSDTSLVAKNIAETFDAQGPLTWDTLTFSDASKVSNALLPDGYQYGFQGFANGKYDAYVKLGTSHPANTVEMTIYTPLDAVFNQSTPGAGQLDPDTMASTELSLRAAALTEDVDADTIRNAMERVITITVEENPEKGYAYYTAVYSYSYLCEYTNEDDEPESEYLTTESSYDICTSKLTDDNGFAVSKLKSLYVFFNPCVNKNDKIVIYHTNGKTPLDVFLVAQGDSSAIETVIESRNKDNSYWSNQYTTVLWNMTNHVTYKYYSGEVFFDVPDFAQPSLVKTEQQNRIFDVTIDIFASGDTTQKLFTLNTTTIG